MLFSNIQIYLINLLLCIAILLLGIIAYKKTKRKTTLFIGIAFGLFAISHLIIILEIKQLLAPVVLTLRTSAYLLIIYSIFIKLINLIKSKTKFKIATIVSTIFTFSTIIAIIAHVGFFIFKYFPLNIYPKIEITKLNLIVCLIITILSYASYKLSREKIYFYLVFAFFLFSASHAGTIFGLDKTFIASIILVRLLAYTTALFAIYSVVNIKAINIIIGYVSKTKTQLIIIISSIAILILMFYFPSLEFMATDPKPQIFSIHPTSSEKQIVEVKTGMFIKNFPTFDITKNSFVMNAVLWFEFDPHLITLNTIEKFSFEKGTILKKSAAETTIIKDNLFTRFKIKVAFKSSLDYRLFPLEDHIIYIILTNTNLNPQEVVLTSYNTNLTINKETFTGNWSIRNKDVEYGYSKSELDEYNPEKTSLFPLVLFSLDFEKTGMKKTFIIFFTLFIAFFLSIFSLLINPQNKGGILSLSVGSISFLIFNLFVIQRITPDVRYFTISDKIFTLLLTSVFLILLLNIYLIKQLKRETEKKISLIRNYVFLFFTMFILMATYYILYQ